MNINKYSTIREVLCDQRSYKVFCYAAWFMIPVALIVLIALTPAYDAIFANTTTRIVLQIIGACVGVFGTVAGIVLFLGMLTHLFLFDRSSWKLAWLVLFLFTAWFGSSVYFFAVYRKQVVLT